MALDTIPKQEGGKLKAVASGTLPNGQPVVVNSDGTVSVIVETSTEITQSVGSPTAFESAAIAFPAATYDAAAQKVVIAYRDSGNSDRGTAVVGTVSDTSISFGTPAVFETGVTTDVSIEYDANAQKVVVAYKDEGNSNYGTAVVGTVSGTSISFGTPVVFESANTFDTSVAYDSNAQKVVIAYGDSGNSSYGTAIVGTVSGTTISFGSAVVFESAFSLDMRAVYDSAAQKVVIAYRDQGNGGRGTAIVGTVSGTSISFGSPVIFENGGLAEFIDIEYDSTAQKVVIAYSDDTNSQYGTAIVGSVSGSSLSFGTAVVFESARTEACSVSYHSAAEKVVISYRDRGNSNAGTLIVGTVSGTSISFGTAVVFDSDDAFRMSSAYDSNAERVVIAYRNQSNSDHGESVVFRAAYTSVTTNLTASNYIGISTGGTYADGSNATVKIIGNTSDEQSGLTAGQSYYVQTDGTIGTTPADPSVLAGTAVSATKMVVKS
jgi:hypothetical protein